MCAGPLAPADDRRWACPAAHHFDVARQGYLNLLVAGQRRSRRPGDDDEMVTARRRFLATGAYDPVSAALARTATAALATATPAAPAPGVGGSDQRAPVVLDVGCGEGHHTRRVAAAVEADGRWSGTAVLGVDVAKRAVALAAAAHPGGAYAVASAAALPLADGAVDVCLDVFGPVMVDELARVIAPGGALVVAHPAPDHLASLRRLVYAEARPHETKDPLRAGRDRFGRVATASVAFPLVFTAAEELAALFTMTPYRWHAARDTAERLAEAACRPGGFVTGVDVVVSTYRRNNNRPAAPPS